MDLYGDLAGLYLEFAEHAAGQSPCFEAWAARSSDRLHGFTAHNG